MISRTEQLISKKQEKIDEYQLKQEKEFSFEPKLIAKQLRDSKGHVTERLYNHAITKDQRVARAYASKASEK